MKHLSLTTGSEIIRFNPYNLRIAFRHVREKSLRQFWILAKHSES